MKIHFRNKIKWMIDGCDFHAPFYPFDGPIIFGGKNKKEMPKNIDALIEGFDICPRGTIEKLYDIIEKEAPHRIKYESRESFRVLDGETIETTTKVRVLV